AVAANRARTSSTLDSAIDNSSPCPAGVRLDPARQLVVDRPGDTCMRLGENALTDDDDRRADGQLAVELDRERIHRNGADDPARLARHADLRPGEVTAEAVRVAHRHDSDPGRSLRDEATSVAGALSRLEKLDLRKARVPRQDRLQAVLGRIGVERRQ